MLFLCHRYIECTERKELAQKKLGVEHRLSYLYPTPRAGSTPCGRLSPDPAHPDRQLSLYCFEGTGRREERLALLGVHHVGGRLVGVPGHVGGGGELLIEVPADLEDLRDVGDLPDHRHRTVLVPGDRGVAVPVLRPDGDDGGLTGDEVALVVEVVRQRRVRIVDAELGARDAGDEARTRREGHLRLEHVLATHQIEHLLERDVVGQPAVLVDEAELAVTVDLEGAEGIVHRVLPRVAVALEAHELRVELRVDRRGVEVDHAAVGLGQRVTHVRSDLVVELQTGVDAGDDLVLVGHRTDDDQVALGKVGLDPAVHRDAELAARRVVEEEGRVGDVHLLVALRTDVVQSEETEGRIAHVRSNCPGRGIFNGRNCPIDVSCFQDSEGEYALKTNIRQGFTLNGCLSLAKYYG